MWRRKKKESRTDHDIFKPRRKRGRGEENTEYPLSRMWSTPKGENVLRPNQKHIAHNQQNIFHNQQNIFHNQQNIFYIMTRNTQSREFSKILLFIFMFQLCLYVNRSVWWTLYLSPWSSYLVAIVVVSQREIQQGVNTFVLVLSPSCANSFAQMAFALFLGVLRKS